MWWEGRRVLYFGGVREASIMRCERKVSGRGDKVRKWKRGSFMMWELGCSGREEPYTRCENI